MEQYIDKGNVMAEIEKLKGKVFDGSSYCDGWQHALRMLEIELNTLKVKDEVASIDPLKAMKEALHMEYEKGRADVLRDIDIDPDEMVADFCSQPLSKTRSLASIYRQGITDILRKIINYEENSITSTCSIDDSGVR